MRDNRATKGRGDLLLKYDEPFQARRKRQRFIPDSSRVITRFFGPGGVRRQRRIINRVLSLPDENANVVLEAIVRDFSDRHQDLEGSLLRHFSKLESLIDNPGMLTYKQKLLMGAFFTKEYSIESVAFFNPSIVAHPNQADLEDGSLRVILSFRAIGEGHISSLTFRSAVLDTRNNLFLEPVSSFVGTPEVALNPTYNKDVFHMILKDGLKRGEITDSILGSLSREFRFSDLQDTIQGYLLEHNVTSEQHETIEMIYWVARSNFVQSFKPDSRLSERVIFPTGRNESNGIEDARFVCFTDDRDRKTYYATFSAYNGKSVLPMLLETHEFSEFKMLTLNGRSARGKGMALFPRKINGRFAMVSRQDGENLYLMLSDRVHFWDKMRPLRLPKHSWEFVQIGNCGSPIETDRGWLLLTHGVGAMREYCIGALLLDLEDPARVIGALEEPLIVPNDYEREGYVPNVVYTCGAIIHNAEVVIPYALSDTSSGVATVGLESLMDRMVA